MRPEQHDDFVPAGAPPGHEAADAADDGPPVRSLLADVEALIDDARIWFDAEVGYQKSRAGYVAGRVKLLLGLGLGVVFFLVMALFGLVVGLLIALTPLITAWGATAVVVGVLLAGALLMVRGAASVWRTMLGAIDERKDRGNG